MEVFTYANNQAKNYNTGGSIRKIKFVEKCGGYAAIPEHDNNYQVSFIIILLHFFSKSSISLNFIQTSNFQNEILVYFFISLHLILL